MSLLFECMNHIDFIKETLDQHEFYKLRETGKVYRIFICKRNRLHFYLIQMFCQTRDGAEDLSSFLIFICILCIFNFPKKEQWSKHNKLEEFCKKKKCIYYTQNIEPLFINNCIHHGLNELRTTHIWVIFFIIVGIFKIS